MSLRLAGGQLVLALVVTMPVMTVPVVAIAAGRGKPVRSECERALLEVQAAIESNVETENFEVARREEKAQPTVTTESERSGGFGGKLLTLRKTGARWASRYVSVGYDPQGDPRWFIELLGPEAAKFFGFEVVGDDRVIVPDAREFSGALKRLNEELKLRGKAPVAISYYTTDDNENSKVGKYVDAFGTNMGLPLAASGNHLIHDLSFHTGAIFYSEDVVKFRAHVSRYLRGFIEFLKTQYHDRPLKRRAVGRIAYLLLMHETIGIDAASGLVTPSTIALLRDPGSDGGHKDLFRSIGFMLAEGKTPYDYWISKLRAFEPESPQFFYEYTMFTNADEVHDLLAFMSIAELKMNLWHFDQKMKTPGAAEFNAKSYGSDMATIDQLCQDIGLRRVEIRDVVLTLVHGTKSR